MQIKELFTRTKHNEGVCVEIKDEAGAVLGWLRVRGLDSDAYRKAHDTFNREMVRLASAVRAKADAPLLAATQAEKDAAALTERVALVADWSFEDPCTPENITLLLQEAPYLSDRVYYAANDRDRFLGTASQASISGQNTSSDASVPQQQEQATA
jgi:hypothetical protein